MSEDEKLLDFARAGDRRALARLLTLVERDDPAAEALMERATALATGAHLVGITGAPGAGKSTLAAALARELRSRGQRVAIVAVDPSSPYSGGALLGDRVRMAALHDDPGVFVRSLASRGASGGLADAAIETAIMLAACGFETVLVETVGAGQGELDVAAEADTTVLVVAPGLGDEVQALKAGIVEVADVIAVNKSDREGAERLVSDLTFACQRRGGTPGEWNVPVLTTIATKGEGVADLTDAVWRHRGARVDDARTCQLAEARLLRSAARLVLVNVTRAAREHGRLAALTADVAARRLTPRAAARQLLGEEVSV